MHSRFAIIGAGLLVATAAQGRAQGVQLRYNPPVGQVTHYRTASRSWSSPDTTTAPTAQVAMYQTQTVMGMDSGNYVVKTVTDSTVMEGGRGGGRDMMRGMAVTVKMDPRGHVLSSQVTPPPGLPPIIANMLTRNSGANNNPRNRVWPEGTINPGDTWTDSMTMSAGGGRQAKPVVFVVTYKFERLERQAGNRIVIISMTGAPHGGDTGTVTGEMAVDVDAGRMAHMVSDVTQGQGRTRMTMDMLP
jgi:hypothetical protein